jgi:YaiO family outer membrane protein
MNFQSHKQALRLRILLAVFLAATVLVSAPAARAQILIASTNPSRVVPLGPPPEPQRVPQPMPQPATSLAEFAAVAPSPPEPQQAPPPAQAVPGPFLGRFEVSQWGTSVSNGFGNWNGGGLHLFLDPTPRVSLLGEVFYEHRPNETEQAGAFAATIHLTKWFYTTLTISGGGPDDSAAFFPRYRYDINGTLATPIHGFMLTGGWTRLQYGNPVSGRIIRGGFIQYAGKVILQGTVNFNNSRPGNHKAVDGIGSIQIGHEGRYWVGATGGGGTEAWQTLGLFPASVQFDGYNLSFFTRKWITRSFGVVFRYNYFIKHTAYHSNGGEIRFFWQF